MGWRCSPEGDKEHERTGFGSGWDDSILVPFTRVVLLLCSLETASALARPRPDG